MAQQELTCERDGESTRLTCVQCAAPICPRCLIRTPVGMKCSGCGVEPGALRYARRRQRGRVLAPLALLLLVAGVIAMPRLISSDGSPATTVLEPATPNTGFIPPVRFGRIGVEARDEDLAFVVESFQCGATEAQGTTGTLTPQGVFCFVAVDVRNVGRGPVTFVAREQILMDAQQRRFGPDSVVTAAHPANAGRDVTAPVINPGNQLRLTLVYDIPPDARPTVAALRAHPSSPGAYVGLNPPPP